MKVITAEEAAQLITDNSTVALSGSGAVNVVAEQILAAIEARFLSTGRPRGLTLFHPQGIGDKEHGGVAHFAHPGLCRRVIGGHWGLSPAMSRLAEEEQIEAYNLPQGVMAQMLRDMSARGPGVITKIGLDTFVDPTQEGGKMNKSAKEELVERITLDGETWLRYRPLPVDIAVIRGTSADEDGYISMEEEVHYDEVASMAAAAKNNGGLVIAQVKYLKKRGEIPCAQVKVPGFLVDYVVEVPDQRQSMHSFYCPAYCGASKEPELPTWPNPGLDIRKFIARRQALELRPGMVVNIGLGISNGVPAILAEEGVWEKVVFSLEQGQSGGVPIMGPDAGTMSGPRIIVEQPIQHDMYHGGILDAACLSAGEIDRFGNVNVSKLGRNVTGCGGFIDISQESKRIIFAGSMCVGSVVSLDNGTVRIQQQGTVKKFVNQVKQITYSSRSAIKKGQYVVFITERGVFHLGEDGLVLTEIAPGIDLQRDILEQMEFAPKVSKQLRQMPAELFAEGRMGIEHVWTRLDQQKARLS